MKTTVLKIRLRLIAEQAATKKRSISNAIRTWFLLTRHGLTFGFYAGDKHVQAGSQQAAEQITKQTMPAGHETVCHNRASHRADAVAKQHNLGDCNNMIGRQLIAPQIDGNGIKRENRHPQQE